MSQRNWKTTQRKTRNLQPNLAARPIGTTLTSIKESGNSISTSSESHSLQSSADSSPANMMSEKQRLGEQEKAQHNDSNIFQIIEEECYNGQLQRQQQHQEKHGQTNHTVSPPSQAFQHNLKVDDDEMVYSESHDDYNNEEKGKDSYEEQEDDDDDDDDDAPIIYAHHDDDSISQITSSIAGNSLYTSDYMLSRLSSIPSINNGQKSQQSPLKSNYGGTSQIRSRGWNSNGSSSNPVLGLNDSNNNRSSNENQKSAPLMDDEELDKFFGPSDDDDENKEESENEFNENVDQRTEDIVNEDHDNGKADEEVDGLIDVNIYTNNHHTNTSQTQHHYHHTNNNDEDDITLKDMYSIGPSISNESQRTFNKSTQSRSTIIAFLKQTRFKTKSAFIKTKHTINKYLSSNSSNVQQKKDDDHNQNRVSEETDYFGILMSSSFVASSPNSPSPHKKNSKEKQLNALRISCFLVLVWLLLYLAKIGNDSALEKNKNKRRGKGIPLPFSGKLRGADLNVQTIVQGVQQDVEEPQVNAQNLNPDPLLPDLQPVQQAVQQDVQPIPPVVQQEVQSEPQNNVAIATTPSNSHVGVPLPAMYNNFVDVNIKSDHAYPLFWHVPRSAGGTINEILGVCYHLRMASNAGTLQGHDHDASLRLVDEGAGHSYVNVDVSTSQGIERAVSLGLVPSGLSDVIVTSLINESAPLFDPVNQGRLFTLLRHPIERAASLFHFWQGVNWRNHNTFNEELANISITDFHRKQLGESNWQVRYLTNQVTKAYIDESDLNMAKEILRRKCLVGLISQKEESIARFEKYFGWHLNNEADKECLNNKVQWDWKLKYPHEAVVEGSEVWNLIAAQNQYDLELYEYAKVLFAEQSALVQ